MPRLSALLLLSLALPACTGRSDEKTTAPAAAASAARPAGSRAAAAGPLTSRYAGEYSWGDDQREKPGGTLTVYPESDSTVLFYVDVCLGAPSYHLAQLLGRATVRGQVATHFSKEDYDEHGCRLKITFAPATAVVEGVPGFGDCEFAMGAYADGTYRRVSSAVPRQVVDGAGDTLRFAQLTADQLRGRP